MKPCGRVLPNAIPERNSSQCDCRETQDSAVLLKAGHNFFGVFPTVAIFPGWAGMHSAPSLSPCAMWFSLPAAAPGPCPGSCAGWARQQLPKPPWPRRCLASGAGKAADVRKASSLCSVLPSLGWTRILYCGQAAQKGRQAWKRRMRLCL